MRTLLDTTKNLFAYSSKSLTHPASRAFSTTVNGVNGASSQHTKNTYIPDKKGKNSPPHHANVIIVGGGVIGTSVAYHLAKKGVKDVVLLERDKLTSGTTWHAAGLINTFGSLSATSTSMRKYTKELYSRILPEETNMDTGFMPIGFIELACDEHRLEYYRRVAAFNRLCGVEVSELNPHKVKDKFPLVDTNDVLAGFFVKDDGRANPSDVTMALARGAKIYGAQIYENVAVNGITSTDYLGPCSSTVGKTIKDTIPRVTGVTLENGDEIEANVVVNCCGMWARQFAEKCGGINVPNQAAEHYYLITDKMHEVDPLWPVVEDSSKCVYIRPEGGGLMLGLFERMGAPWMIEKVPSDFSFGEIEADWDRMAPYLEDAMKRVPATLQVGAKNFFCGPESFTPDGSPIIGEAPELKQYYVAAGLNSLGILSGGGVGDLLAQWIIKKQPPSSYDVTGINIDRFHNYQRNPKYRADRVGEILGETYKVHYPDHNLSSCRKVKRSPLHQQMLEQNAYFRDVSGWESPSWFGDELNPKIAEENFGRQSFFQHWQQEHIQTRNNVALFDMSFMSKFSVKGDDAGAFLNYISTANVDGDSGKITYTQFLNKEGFLEADVTITKIGPGDFLVISTDTMHNHVLTHMRKHLTNQHHVFVNDVTNSFAQINIQGPNSRKLLQSITSTNLDDEMFPFRTSREIDIKYGVARCTRITYVGELGYELFIPSEFAAHIYEVIVDKGKQFDLQHAGLRALGSLRLEKAYRDYGHDIDNTDTIVEAGLSFTCDFSKDNGFIGMEHVLRQKQEAKERGGLTKRMAQILLEDPEPLLHHGEVLWRNGERIAEVRSASYGHSLKGAVGLCMLESKDIINMDFLKSGEWSVEIGNRKYSSKVSFSPLYDPKGKKIQT